MINSSVAELYFIIAMMILILVLSVAASIFFVRQYRKEKRENPLTRKNLEKFQASLKAREQTNEETNEETKKETIDSASSQISKQGEYVEK